ncbi:hypothetical protein [Brevundimonas sp.]|uniref:hypothetical protein n=1 Tax=Brevundimonas sp. TaxID=1871086 RepID=UPI00289B3DF8|nr:hypothetical protein [Brevundimonas sp.]
MTASLITVVLAACVEPGFAPVLHWGQPVANAVGFIVGAIAFGAVRSWLRRPGVVPAAPKEEGQ